MRLKRWLIPLPSIVLSLFPLAASAEPVAGLTAVGYTINAIPPTKSHSAYPTCGNEIENNINRNFNGEPFQQCGADYFMVHYTGYITIPANNTISFMVAADDGGTVNIGDIEFGTWNNKGCTWSQATSNTFTAGTYALDGWFYEATGLTCLILAWNIDNQGWQIVPDNAFTSDGETSTTTTTSTTSTSTSTTTTTSTTSSTSTTSTTTQPNTTTTSFASTPTSTLDQKTSTTSSTTQLPTTTTTTTTLSTTTLEPSTTTIYVAPSTTAPARAVTEPDVTVPTGTVAQVVEVRPIETTSPPPTEELKPKIDMPLTTGTQIPETVAQPTSTTDLSVPRPNTTESRVFVSKETLPDGADLTSTARDGQISQAPSSTTTPNSTLSQAKSTQTESEALGQDTSEEVANQQGLASDSSLAVAEFINRLAIDPVKPLEDDDIVEILETLSTATQVEIQGAMTVILEAGLSSEQTVLFVSTPEILASISGEQAEELFENLEVDDLSDAELSSFTAVIQMAPPSVKKEFEKAINVFGSKFETYVPEGSLIPVSQRRALVAVGALLLSAPAMPSTARSRVRS